jgi:hypothetical protein
MISSRSLPSPQVGREPLRGCSWFLVLGSWISELKRKNPAVVTAGLFES